MARSRVNIKSLAWGGAILLAVAISAPASAQFSIPQVPGFSSNYPWFNQAPESQGNQSFQWFLANHPNIASALARNPGLLYNADWRSETPALRQYLVRHPYEWQRLNDQDWAEGPPQTRWGDYDDRHQWRDAYWWHRNHPSSFYDNHQDWASLDSRWLDEDGAYDNQRRWHYGEWWYNHDRGWVTSRHPNWLREHRSWEEPDEQQNYRRQHAMLERNEKYDRQRWNADRREDRQKHQRAIDQEPANVKQQHTMRMEREQPHHADREQSANREHPHAMRQVNQQVAHQTLQPAHQQQSAHQPQNRVERQQKNSAQRPEHGKDLAH